MGWMGKIIGGTLGFFLGGPLGLIAGAVFGHMIDKGSALDSSGYSSNPYHSSQNVNFAERSQMVFFVGAFSMLAKMASVDGRVTEGARVKIHEFMVRDLRLDQQSYNVASNIFNQALSQNVTFEALADQFYQNFYNENAVLQTMIDIFFRIAMEDQRMSANEERLINYAGRAFRIPDSIMDSFRRQYGAGTTSSSKAYAILGLKETATEQEIKKAYRKLILEFHPDAIAAKGVAEEFKVYATKRFREIQEAYEQICSERGIK